MIRSLIFCCLPPLAMASIAAAAPVRSGAVEAELIAGSDTAVAGKSVVVAIRLKAAPHWHVYWENPGDSGTPVRVKWTLPEGITAGALRFPVPKAFDTAGFVTYGHESEALFLAEMNIASDLAAGAGIPIKATVSWLACDPSRCVPGRAELATTLKVTSGSPKPNKWSNRISAAVKALPQAPGKGKISTTVADATVTITLGAGTSSGATTGAFFPAQSGIFKLTKPKPEVTVAKDGGVKIVLHRDGDAELPETIRGLLTLDGAAPLLIDAAL